MWTPHTFVRSFCQYKPKETAILMRSVNIHTYKQYTHTKVHRAWITPNPTPIPTPYCSIPKPKPKLVPIPIPTPTQVMVIINANTRISPYTKGLNTGSHFTTLRSMQCLFPTKLKVYSELPQSRRSHTTTRVRRGRAKIPISHCPRCNAHSPWNCIRRTRRWRRSANRGSLNLVQSNKHRQFLLDCLLSHAEAT